MDIKEILKQSLKDGANQFIDSTINQLNEEYRDEDEPSFEELLDDAAYMLNFIQGILKSNAKIKYKYSIDFVWEYLMEWAILLKGNNSEGIDIQGMNTFFERTNDISIRWERTKALLEYLKTDEASGEYKQYFLSLPNLQRECDIYYYNILQLKNWKSGFFLTRKRRFKKQIRRCISYLCLACKDYYFELTVHIPTLMLMGIK